jgi:hypothetical protein
MNQYIAAFLFHHKICPLPGIGHLSVQTGLAQADIVNQQLLAPVPSIVFSNDEIPADELIEFIAVQRQESFDSSKTALIGYVQSLRQGLPISQVGYFSGDAAKNLVFHPVDIDPLLLPSVAAVRVVHPDAEHAILVGDKESTNTAMTEYYSDEQHRRIVGG